MEANMKRYWDLLILAVAIVAGIGSSASAQNPFPYNQNPYNSYLQQTQQQNQRPPVLSPYLNLLNRGNPAVNYYNFVLPQLQQNQQYGGFQGPQAGYQLGDEAILDPNDPTTRGPRSSAHPTTFGNTGAFFNSLGTIGPATVRPNSAGVPAPQSGRR
jgi:hypothetical protein